MTTLVSYVYAEEQSIRISDDDAKLLKQGKVTLAGMVEKYADTVETFEDWDINVPQFHLAYMEQLD
jgi:hypothetical protein